MGFGTMERREKVKRLNWVLLMGAVLLAGLTGLAACPPGTIDLTTILAVPTNINNPGTYCVPATGVTLAAGQVININVSGVTIVGETPDAPLNAGTLAAASVVITVAAGAQNTVIQNFRIVNNAAGVRPIRDNGMGTRIQGVTFQDNGTPFNAYVIQLNGINPQVSDCTFIVTTPGNPEIIDLRGGMGARIFNNRVDGAGASPAFFIRNNSGAPYNDLQVWGNTVDNANAFIGGANGYVNSVIRDNDCGVLQTDGINLAGNSANTQVLRNTLTYDAGAGGVNYGIRDTGGSNLVYRGNRVIADPASSAASHGIYFASSNTVIEDNIIDTAGAAPGAAHGIATAAGATNGTIRNNVIQAASGDGIRIGNGTNYVITGNRVTNVAGAGIVSNGNSLISQNTISNVAGGHAITAAVNDRIEENTITGVSGGDGINVPAAITNVTIRANTIRSITGGNDGIDVGGVNCQVIGNTIESVVGGGHGIVISADNQTISGNTVRGVATGFGINIGTQSNNTVVDNRVEDVGQSGIFVNGGDNNTIRGNTLVDVAKNALGVAGSRFAAIEVGFNSGSGAGQAASDNNVIEANVIKNPGSTVFALGIVVSDPNNVTVSNNNRVINNTISDFTRVTAGMGTFATGIQIYNGLGNRVEGNTISNTGNMRVGLDVLSTESVVVKGNKIEGMTEVGLLIRGGTVNTPLRVEGNSLVGNVTGIRLDSGAAVINEVNVVTGGATALHVNTLANADRFTVENNCFTAPILVRNAGIGTLVAKKNYWGATPQPGVNVFGAVDTSDPLASCPAVPAPAPTPTLSKNYGARAGWYMVSVPTTGDTAGIFGVTLYWWNGTSYTSLTGTAAIEPVKGYWANLPANKTVTASGSVPTTDQTVALVKGWNMISVPWAYPKAAIQVQKGTETKSWADAVAAGWVRDTIWGSTTAVTSPNDYQSVTTLDPWYG